MMKSTLAICFIGIFCVVTSLAQDNEIEEAELEEGKCDVMKLAQ